MQAGPCSGGCSLAVGFVCWEMRSLCPTAGSRRWQLDGGCSMVGQGRAQPLPSSIRCARNLGEGRAIKHEKLILLLFPSSPVSCSWGKPSLFTGTISCRCSPLFSECPSAHFAAQFPITPRCQVQYLPLAAPVISEEGITMSLQVSTTSCPCPAPAHALVCLPLLCPG